jgi:hypothetical protein
LSRRRHSLAGDAKTRFSCSPDCFYCDIYDGFGVGVFTATDFARFERASLGQQPGWRGCAVNAFGRHAMAAD